jgi:uncharacterized protein DUF6699
MPSLEALANDLSWTFGEPEGASTFDDDAELVPVTAELLDAVPEPSVDGAVIELPRWHHERCDQAVVRGGTVRDVLQAVHDALTTPLDPEDLGVVAHVEETIERFRNDLQDGLREDFQNGKLEPLRLMGDHRFFEGFSNGGGAYYSIRTGS